ncbi:MAG: hypothetical protein DRN04_18155 [Thermoprotei archaeon]|nr:MAG: hypothetical protein DRN04_18155 [Thermoprotei archaeon]
MFDDTIEKYGVDVVLKKRTVTGEDEYGHPTVSYSESSVKAVVHVPSRKDYESMVKEPGVLGRKILIFVFPSTVNVSELDIIVYDNKEYVVRRVEKIHYKGSVVAVKAWGLSSE